MNTPGADANIQTIVRLEQEFLEGRSRWERVGDAVADFAGSMLFIGVHLVWFVGWIAVNTGRLGIPAFDPYPYVFLSMVVSLEAVLLSTFVLMKQNRMSRRSDQRNHLNLQVDLLAEQEITKILQMQRALCDHLGLKEAGEDQQVEQMSRDTPVESLARDLIRKLPEK